MITKYNIYKSISYYIGSSLRQRKCPNPGRYIILGPFDISTSFHQQHRSERHSRITKRRTWHEDVPQKELHEQHQQIHHHNHHHHHHHHQHHQQQQQQQYEGEHHQQQRGDCKNTNVQIGCVSSNQTEIVIGKTCDTEETTYFCHGSWEEKDSWYTIVSLKTNQASLSFEQTFCFSMRFSNNIEKTSMTTRAVKMKVSEQKLWLTKLDRICRREQVEDERSYTLINQGICEDVEKAYSSLASLFSNSRIVYIAVVGNYAAYIFLLR
ncbi:ubiquitin carboxyl-terminal hydrolase 34 [Apis florea]|uniref:ubiquitin carboxyl-terminal hydrolase 34 n=1 Tax=Apis florea TaxID=7463 RepID=UPI000629AF6E|nr:ubiquitin carboxyl-terminal hydrolase 34 [Apis florea]